MGVPMNEGRSCWIERWTDGMQEVEATIPDVEV